jgi:hypothetical protein
MRWTHGCEALCDHLPSAQGAEGLGEVGPELLQPLT